MNIIYNFATRSRPKKFFKCLDNIKDYSVQPYKVIASVDMDDESMNNDDVIKRMELHTNLTVYWGESESKIHAINRSVQDYKDSWDILINMSDDMWFVYPAFDNAIRDGFTNHFPDLDGVLHYNDSNQKENCMTMSIIGRKYYERDNYIYHPSYQSLWCDKEAEEVARIRGKYKYMGDGVVLFNHNHPAWGKAQYDPQYHKTEAQGVNQADFVNCQTRTAANFYL